jgi:hypothetical protein
MPPPVVSAYGKCSRPCTYDTQTPSPYRFLKGKRSFEASTSQAKPSSALPKPVTVDTNVSSLDRGRSNVSSQFAPTPRFSFGRATNAAQYTEQRSPSPPKRDLLDALRPPQLREDVDDANDRDNDNEMLDGDAAEALPTTELGGAQQWSHDVALSPKRRRLECDDQQLGGQDVLFKRSAPPLAPQNRNSVPSFQPQRPRATSFGDEGGQHRPAFLRPAAPPEEPSEPLPQTFSPHKRGQKFVPGGMAATVQQWVISTGQAAIQSRKGQGYLSGEDYVTRVRLQELTGHGPFTARGETMDGESRNVLLAGTADSNKAEQTCVNAGHVVGVRAPVWDVEVDGSQWTVCVDWKITS